MPRAAGALERWWSRASWRFRTSSTTAMTSISSSRWSSRISACHPEWVQRQRELEILEFMPLVIPSRLKSTAHPGAFFTLESELKPLPLPALDLSRHGKNVVMRLVTDQGSMDVSLPRVQAATMATALSEYAGQ